MPEPLKDMGDDPQTAVTPPAVRRMRLSRPVRLLLWFIAVVALVIIVLIVSRSLIRPDVSNPIERIEYSQYQPVPNYDTNTYTVTNGQRIARFDALVKKYSVDLADFNSAQNDGCTGGLATTLTLYTAGNSMQKLQLYSCRGPKASGDFVADATRLVSDWHAVDEKSGVAK
ncbi:MAG: hypothetical protein JWN80_1023 [Microbacteriaceae bacterium]|jgi:cell division protein FtsL|nr:hypothetical protein [Microbacteriaceae bacterium]